MTKKWKDSGNKKASIKMFFEVIRWETGTNTESKDRFKLNNNYHSRYARLISNNNPELSDMFELRELKS